MKTPKEIAQLKTAWVGDPCWDIETTAGYEEHTEELKAYRVGMEHKWAMQRNQRNKEQMASLGCNYDMLVYLDYLETRIAKLEEELIIRGDGERVR